MKKTILALVLALTVSLGFSSCTTIMPVHVSEAPIGNKVGSSKSTVLFGTLYLNNSIGVHEAAKNGGIKEGVATVDRKVQDFIIFQQVEIIVTGN